MGAIVPLAIRTLRVSFVISSKMTDALRHQNETLYSHDESYEISTLRLLFRPLVVDVSVVVVPVVGVRVFVTFVDIIDISEYTSE